MVITTKPVNTTIPADYHNRAKVHGIEWTEALCLGIDVLNDDSYHKEKKTLQKIKLLKGKLKIYENRLIELRTERTEKEQIEKQLTKKEIKFLIGVEERLIKGAELSAILRHFNYEFKKTITTKNFEYLIKKHNK